jgi:hypothetical protein
MAVPITRLPGQVPNELLALQAYAGQSCARQWRAFLAAMFVEFYELGDQKQLDALMTRVGVRFADSQPLPACQSLEDLEGMMNRVWEDIDWGRVRLDENGPFITISHVGFPLFDAEGTLSRLFLGSVLQGVYTRWLQAQGGDTQLTARCVYRKAAATEPLELTYGRHAD